jgi:DNA-binding PadR family transcriptional regulator
MGPQSRRALPASFFDRLVDRVDPHQLSTDRSLDAQSACGRWLALRRLELELPGEQAAQLAGLSLDALQLLEAGLADATLVPAPRRRRLAELLARPDAPWLAEVVDIAIGAAAPRDELLDQVIAELDLVDSLPAASRQALFDELLAAPGLAMQPEQAAQPTDDPALFEMMSLLAEANRHTYAIWEVLNQRYGRVGLANVGVLVMQMLERQWIAEAEQRLEPELDDEPLQYYRLTAAGRRVLETELERRTNPSGQPEQSARPTSSRLRESG